MNDNEWELIEGELDTVLGDADTTSTVTSALAELISTGGKMAADKQNKDATASKQKTAQAAAQAFAAAQTAAAGEKDPNGPLHQKLTAAQLALNSANQAAGIMTPPMGGPEGGKGKPSSNFLMKVEGGLPVYGWGLLGIGFAGAAIAIVKLAGHSAPARGRR